MAIGVYSINGYWCLFYRCILFLNMWKKFSNQISFKISLTLQKIKWYHGHVAHKYKSIYVTPENGNMVMMPKICINQTDVKLSMSNYTVLTNVATIYIPIGCKSCWPLKTHMPHPKSKHLGFTQVLQPWTWHWAYKPWSPWPFAYLAHIIKQEGFSQTPWMHGWHLQCLFQPPSL